MTSIKRPDGFPIALDVFLENDFDQIYSATGLAKFNQYPYLHFTEYAILIRFYNGPVDTCAKPEWVPYEQVAKLQAENTALRKIAEAIDPKKLADKFIGWPVPDSVSPDPCVINPEFKKKWPNTLSGTNFFTHEEAKQMFEYVLQEVLAELDARGKE